MNTRFPEIDKSKSDPRYLPRWDVENPVLYQLEGEENSREATTRDLSGAGTCIIANQSLKAGQRINMTIQLAEDSSIELEGIVLWVEKSVGHNLIGVSFSNITSQDQEVILYHAFELDKDKIAKHFFSGWND